MGSLSYLSFKDGCWEYWMSGASNVRPVTWPELSVFKFWYICYIKNVASSEIYSTWPEQTIYANVIAIISFNWAKRGCLAEGGLFINVLNILSTTTPIVSKKFLLFINLWSYAVDL